MGEVRRTGRVSLDVQGTLAELFQLTCVNFHTFTVEMSRPQSDPGDGSNNNNLFLLKVQGFKLMTLRLREVEKHEILFSCNKKHCNFSHGRKDVSDPESVHVIIYWQMCYNSVSYQQVKTNLIMKVWFTAGAGEFLSPGFCYVI